MADDQDMDETQQNLQVDAKLETNNDDDYTIYIGVDPKNLFESLDVGKLFGSGSYIDISRKQVTTPIEFPDDKQNIIDDTIDNDNKVNNITI